MVDEKLILHLAELSKLSFTEPELKKMTSDMKNIMELMDRVKEADTDFESYKSKPASYGDLRGDTPCKSFTRDDILKNAKQIKKSSFTVPKIM